MVFARDPSARFVHFCRTGDPDALGDVFDRTAGRLMRVALWLAGNRADADDLLQRTFLQAIENRQAFDPAERVLPWLMGLLGNQARKLRRERDRAAALRPATDRVDDPEVAAAARELDGAVRTVRERLGEPYREVLQLYLEQGLSAKEIAARLDRPAGTVRTQLVRALDLLRRKLPGGFVAGLGAIAALDAAAVAAVRSAVIAAARRHVPTVATAGAAATILGGVLVAKKMLSALAVVLLLGGFTAWRLWPSSEMPPPSEAARARTAVHAHESRGAPDPVDAAPIALDRQAVANAGAGVDSGFAELRVVVRWQDDASPAAGIGVSVHSFALSGAFARAAVTDADGAAVLRHLPPAVYWLGSSFVEGVLRAPDAVGPGQEQVALAAGQQLTVEATAVRTTTASGVVVDAEGRPTAGASVWVSAHQSWSSGWQAGRSDANGAFTVPMRGFQYLGARHDGHLPSYTRRLEATKGPHRDLVLALRGPAARIDGTVRDVRGKPVAWARVLVGPQGGGVVDSGTPGLQFVQPNPEQCTSDARGHFTATQVPPGRGTLWVWAMGFGPRQETYEVAAGGALELVVTLEDGAVVAGTVRDGAGRAIAKAGIRFGDEFYNFPQAHATTADDGTFRLAELPALPGGTELVAGKDGRSATARIQLRAGAVTEWNPVIDDGRTIAGTVLGPDGRPCAGLRVGAVHPSYQRPQKWHDTDADGRFVLTNVGDKPRVLRVAQGEVVLSEVYDVAPDRSDVVIRLTVDDLPTAGLRGRILDAAGRAARGSLCLRREGSECLENAQLDDAGRFAHGPCPAGRYEIQAFLDGAGAIALGTFELERGRERVLDDVLLQPTGGAELVVTDAAGEPIAAGTAQVRTADGGGAGSCTIENGRGAFAALQPGRYFVDVSFRMRHAPEVLTAVFEVQSGAVTAVAVRGRPSVRIVIRCRDPLPPSPALSVKYRATTPAGELAGFFATFRANSEPLAAYGSLAPGSYHLAGRASDGRELVADFEVAAGTGPRGREVTVDLPAR